MMDESFLYEDLEVSKTKTKDNEHILEERPPKQSQGLFMRDTPEDESILNKSSCSLAKNEFEELDNGISNDINEAEPYSSPDKNLHNNRSTPISPTNFSYHDFNIMNEVVSSEKSMRTPTPKNKNKKTDYNYHGDTNDSATSIENNPIISQTSTSQARSDPYTNSKKSKNKKRLTKYDQAFKEMEELDDFVKECKNTDEKKFDFGSYSFEMISNPSKYSYEAWQSNLNIRLGADGRRLLLRKLRSISSANHKLWQEILLSNNLSDVKNIFTVATVPTLLRIAHLMGREAWDFALKCACFTYKCPSLSIKENEDGSDLDDFSGNDHNQTFSPSKSQVSTRTPQRNVRTDKSTTTESPIRSLGSQERKRKTPTKSLQDDKGTKNKKLSSEPVKDSPTSKSKEHKFKIIAPKADQGLKSEISPIGESFNMSPRKRKSIPSDKFSADSQSSSMSCQALFKPELEINEKRDFLKYLKRIEGYIKSNKVKVNSDDSPQSVDETSMLPPNQKFQSYHNQNSPDSLNLSDEDETFELKSNEFPLSNSKLTKTLDNYTEQHDSYRREINQLGHNFTNNVNAPEPPITSHDDSTNAIKDQCIFVQFLHCITLLDFTRKFLSSMKGRYSSSNISNGLNNDNEAFIKDDEDSRLKLLNESTGNQIENYIKMYDILFQSSYDSLITSSEIWDPNPKINRI